MEPDPTIALVFYDDAYVEPQAGAHASATAGIYGRHVAGKELLDAYLTHGRWQKMVGLHAPASAQVLTQIWQAHPSAPARAKELLLVKETDFHKTFFPAPPASVVYLPCPPIARYAWARQHGGPDAFALCGVTHTLCPASLVHDLCELVTAPYEAYDALICTSRAAVHMVRAVTGIYADYLRDRHGGSPELRVQLPLIPLGVNPEKFRPPLPEERAAQRRFFQIADDEVAVLFVGRLSFHGKAHPYPMYQGIAGAARATGRKVHLLLAGWTSNSSVKDAFAEGGRRFATGVRVSIVDGTRPETRFAVWHAADLFTSLSDNLQETFGLSVLEAMASGLPVVTSDWNGYRDLVADGETGFLVPTCMIPGAAADVTSRLVFGEIGYDHFMAETNQAAAVDVAEAGAAYARLIADAALRRQMGMAGRKRVLERFAWSHVVAAYEELWRAQEKERRAHAARRGKDSTAGPAPAIYPPIEAAYADWPKRWLKDTDRLRTATAARHLLDTLRAMPLTSYMDAARSTEATVLNASLDAAASPLELGALVDVLGRCGVAPSAARSTLAWLLKYGLLELEG